MMTSYLIKNGHSQFLTKEMEWVYDSSSALFHTPHKDVALNQLTELNTKNIQLRAKVITCALDAKGRPILPQDVAA